jgi:hypothetical protein
VTGRAITDDLTVGHVDHLIGVRDHVEAVSAAQDDHDGRLPAAAISVCSRSQVVVR